MAEDADDVLGVRPGEGAQRLEEVHGEVLRDASGLVFAASGDEGGPSAAGGVNHPPPEAVDQFGGEGGTGGGNQLRLVAQTEPNNPEAV